MKLESISQSIYSVIEKLPSQEAIKNKAIDLAQKIANYINITKLFYAATVLFTFAATTNPFVGIPVCEVIVSGALSACILQSISIMFGLKGRFTAQESQNEVDVVSGAMNLCTWYLSPQWGVTTALLSIGFQATSLAFRKIFEIKQLQSESKT